MFRKFSKFDWVLFSIVLLLLGVGLLALYSLSVGQAGTNYFARQAIFALFGLGALLFGASLDYRHIQKYSTAIYFATLFLLVVVLLFGETVRGTAGWLSFGIFQVQPVEIAKVSLIIFLASFITKKKTELGEWTRVIASLVLTAAIILLVLRQPDLGSSLVLGAIWAGMIAVSGLRFKHFFVLVILGSLLISGSWFTLAPYQKDRLETFIHPESDPQGSGYNVLQAMVAVGSGGITGKGIGHGTQSQLAFLPERHTDFIFAVIAEELGLIGAFLVLLLYLGLLYRIKRVADAAIDNFGYLLAAGMLIMFFVQILVNIGMNVGMLPVTGLPAPLLSYGGSSLVSVCFSLGLLLSIYRLRRPVSDLRISLDEHLQRRDSSGLIG